MKKIYWNFGSALTALLLFVSGGLLIYGNVFNREAGDFMAKLLVMPVTGATLGVVMIFSVLLHLFGSTAKKKTRFIHFGSEDGSVGVSTRAVQDFIERVGREFSAIESIESRLIQDKNALDVAISLKVVSGSKIPELSHVLQQRVRESVRESLGLEDIRNITIQVAAIVGTSSGHTEELPDSE